MKLSHGPITHTWNVEMGLDQCGLYGGIYSERWGKTGRRG